jgi:predicted Zn-dependent peptidase
MPIMSTFDFYTLANGVRVVFVPMLGVESAAIGTYIEAGSRYETGVTNGISHFLEHMVFKGTKKFPTYKETSYLEGLGGLQNAWTSTDMTSFLCKIPADKWREGLEMVKELTLYPTIPAKELEIERGVILEEIHRRDDRPDEIAGEEVMRLMYPGSSLGMTVLGEPKVIKSLKRSDFEEYHNRHYVARRLVVVLAGKFDIDKAKNEIEKWFGGMPSEPGEGYVQYRVLQDKPAVLIKNKDLAAQAHIELAFHWMNNADPRRFAGLLLTAYLGQGLSGRLFTEVREKRGLCYTIRAAEDRLEDTGVWSVYAGLNVDKLEEAVKAILSELQRVKFEKISGKELTESKEKLRGRILFSMEDPLEQMDFYGRQAAERPEEILTHQEVIDRLMQIDAEDIRKVAESLFVSGKMNLAVVGPISQSKKEKLVDIMQV